MNEDVYPKDFFIDLIFTDARTEQNLKLGKKKVKSYKLFEEKLPTPEVEGDSKPFEKEDKKKDTIEAEE